MTWRTRSALIGGAAVVVAAVSTFAMMRPGADSTSPPAPAATPVRRLGAYLPTWGTVALHDVPPVYNLVFAAFGVGDRTGGGAVRFDPRPAQEPAAFAADVVAAHSTGRQVVLSIGGAESGPLHVTTPAQVNAFVSSVEVIVDRYGFDGIDWDLEDVGLWSADAVTAASRALLARYGETFIISVAPGPGNVAWKQWARQMGADLDLFGMQFYEFPAGRVQRIAAIETRIREMVDVYGVEPSKLMIGAMTVGGWCPTCSSPAGVYRDAFVRVQARYPAIAGAYVWSAQLDSDAGWPFATAMRTIVRG